MIRYNINVSTGSKTTIEQFVFKIRIKFAFYFTYGIFFISVGDYKLM